MKKIVLATVFLGIIGIGVWVLQARTPVSLPASKETQSTSGIVNLTESAISSEGQQPVSETATPHPSADSNTSVLNSLSPLDQRKIVILEEIFRSKNDNDPRFDTELKELSPELKGAFRQRYHSTALEKRNERGTIIFLMARSMCLPSSTQAQQVQDLEFLKAVLQEKPCLSLQDCSRDAPAPTEEEVHVAGISETTAHYPQLTALNQCLSCYQRAIEAKPPQTWLADQLVELFQSARRSPNPKVVDQAQLILQQIGR
jgi:hypothetical protein